MQVVISGVDIHAECEYYLTTQSPMQVVISGVAIHAECEYYLTTQSPMQVVISGVAIHAECEYYLTTRMDDSQVGQVNLNGASLPRGKPNFA
jgi:hypothetical protein